ncbi:unnamed protein product [Linum trigynum]|uniref:Uncharacterized protein n=1 Tax=Linum trigynum TaxID=586398 RepID=A0AAV2DPS9_9ROSI
MITTLFLLSSGLSEQAVSGDGELKTYMVLLRRPEGAAFSLQSDDDGDEWYHSFLPPSTASDGPRPLVHRYRHAVTGFAAELTAEEVKAMETKEGFVRAWPDKTLSLATTHSQEFMGLHQNAGVWKSTNYGKGVIIGVVDTGTTPGHPSFSDENMPPPPAKWKGKCELAYGSTCNKKLIGARNFYAPGTPMADDDNGHGTLTSSIAAGSPVKGASLFGQANGTAVGTAPLAHVAVYKACSADGKCPQSAVLAAIDAAVEDGVDVISLSMEADSAPYYEDPMAIGAYGAIRKGVFVSFAAGNGGPGAGTVVNDSPWVLTVGASTINRKIKATVLLGNNAELVGESLTQPSDFPLTLLPLIYAGSGTNASSAFCIPGSLKSMDVKGKIVLCTKLNGSNRATRIAAGQEVKDNGGAAMILMNEQVGDSVTRPDPHVLPASHVSNDAGYFIKTYIRSTPSPTATIVFKGTVLLVPDAPQLAMFSSRGPSPQTSGILKPDVIGPGVNILAAYPTSQENTQNTPFAMASGTSLSTPHLSGVAALVKTAHPDWSPAAIKSAIMTTTYVLNPDNKGIVDEDFQTVGCFDMGAGHVNPERAIHPGLVYDIEPEDYVGFMCGLGYNDTEVSVVVNRGVSCSNRSSITASQLNYPSISVTLGWTSQTYTRIVTNVGVANSSYRVNIVKPEGVYVKVKPTILVFQELNQKLTYSVTFNRKQGVMRSRALAQGSMSWFSFSGFVVTSRITVL